MDYYKRGGLFIQCNLPIVTTYGPFNCGLYRGGLEYMVVIILGPVPFLEMWS